MTKLADLRAQVFERDSEQCRVCRALGMTPTLGLNQVKELAHLKPKGMGGDHGVRTYRKNLICCCRFHHQGPRSIHSGHLKWECLTDQGADGPMSFTFYEKLPKAESRSL